MKAIRLYLVFLFLSINALCRDIPILNPEDPQFSWMDFLIEEDFANLKQAISIQDYQDSIALHSANSWIVRFRIIDNQVEGPRGACYNMLEYLCEAYGLPDIDFLYWNQDGPGATVLGKAPILTGARAIGARNTLLFTDWLFDIKNPLGPWNQERQIIDDQFSSMPWSMKENKLFWRGMGTDIWSGGYYSTANWVDHARGMACFLSLKFPKLIDAAFVGFHHFLCLGGEYEMKKLTSQLPMSQHVSLVDHLKYKYHLQITGLMANFPRDRWQFYSESVVFRHAHPHEMYWYSLLNPWEHYIPIETSMNDLVIKVKWARSHDKACHKIAKAARFFAQTHFMPEHIALYSYKVLLRYARIQAFDPKLREVP